MDSSDDAIISKSLDGNIQSWNPAAERIFGYSAEEAIGRPITLIVPPDRLDEELQIVETLKRGGRINQFETVRVTKEGQLIHVAISVSPVRDATGIVIGGAKVLRDITTHKDADNRLRESEHALRDAHERLKSRSAELARFNHTAVGREMRIIELKRQINELLAEGGRKARYPLEFEPTPSPSPATEQPSNEDVIPLNSILRTHELHERPARPPDYEAESRALTSLAQTLADSPRSILQSLADKVLEVLKAGSSGLSLLTEDGEKFYWAAIAGAWRPHLGGGTPRYFGPCGDVLDCQAPLLFTHWEQRYPYLATATPLAEEGLLVPFEVDGRAVGTIWAISHDPDHHFDGEDLRLLESLGRFASAGYQAVHLAGAYEERRAALNLLEDAVHARQVAEDSNRKLQEREAMLREADQQKNEFLALLGHELRNPLTPINISSELLSHIVGEDPKARRAIDVIKRQVSQLARLVDDLLDVARITQGRIQLRKQPLDLGAIVSQAVETVEPELRAKQHRISVDISTHALYVEADPTRLVQCIVNVLANAAKYTEFGGEVWVHTRADDNAAVVEITDTGIGIGPEFLPRVFDLFVQGDRSLDRSQGGLGIGLAVVKRLIETHQGEVVARSAGLGQGATSGGSGRSDRFPGGISGRPC